MRGKKLIGALTLAGFALTAPLAGVANAIEPTTVVAQKLISIEEAQKIAAKKVPKGAKLIDQEQDTANGKIIYDFDYLLNGTVYEVDVNQVGKIEAFSWDKNVQWAEEAKNKYVANKKYTAEVTFEEAKKIAEKATTNAEIVEMKLAVEDGYYVYKAELKSKKLKYELEINPETGTVIEYTEEIFNRTAAVKPEQKVITEAEAKKIALNNTRPGTMVIDIELKQENKVWVYETKLVNYKQNIQYEIDIEATAGKVLSLEEGLFYHEQDSNMNVMSLEKAKQIAYKVVPKGVIVDVKLTKDNGIRVYEVKMQKDTVIYYIQLDAVTGEVVKEKTVFSYVAPEIDEEIVDGLITKETAIKIALAKVPGGKVVECELDEDDDEMVYKIEIEDKKYEYEFEIDAVTGKILEMDKDELDDDDDERDDD